MDAHLTSLPRFINATASGTIHGGEKRGKTEKSCAAEILCGLRRWGLGALYVFFPEGGGGGGHGGAQGGTPRM